jgi:hypothetical protein
MHSKRPASEEKGQGLELRQIEWRESKV